MLPKIKALIVRSELNIQQNDVLLNKKESEHRMMMVQLASLAKESTAIMQLSQSLYPGGEINKEKLFAIQRRQGALKRKLADIKMQVSQTHISREHCEKEKQEITEKRKCLKKKMDKYLRLQRAEHKKKILREARMEESEIEERTSWQR